MNTAVKKIAEIRTHFVKFIIKVIGVHFYGPQCIFQGQFGENFSELVDRLPLF